MRKNLSSIIVLLFALFIPIGVSAHFLGYDSVDGDEIRWEEYTKYNDAYQWANSRWNALGYINIAPDTWSTVTDLEWLDVTQSGVSWDGRYYQNWGADHIELNTSFLDSYSTFNKRAVAAHELGHALGLNHSYSHQLMNSCATCSGYNTPQSHDISDYNSLWR